MEKKFDERQQLVRGRIFKHAVFIAIGLLFLEIALELLFEIYFFESVWSNYAIILTTVAVMTAEMIWKDAYPMSEKKQILAFGFLGLSGLFAIIMTILHVLDGASFLAENSLSDNAAMLFFGVICDALSIWYFIKYFKNKSKKEEE